MKKKKSADSIIRAEYLLAVDKDFLVISDGAVAINGGKIASVGRYENVAKDYYCDTVIGGRGRVLLPGLINTHTHAAMVYFRGLADDLPLKEWLEGNIWPAESKWLGPEFISDAIELACLEMLKAGITTYNDMYFFGESAGIATKRIGMRAVLGAGIVDFPTIAGKNAQEYLQKAEAFIRDWEGDELITPSAAPHSPYACKSETLKRVRKLADKYAVPIHIHVAETEWEVKDVFLKYGKTPVRHLDGLGFLDGKVLAAHCIWLDSEEVEILSKRGTGVSHCLESNLKLASGIAPVTAMLKSGVKVTFGTDSAASNNDLNIFSEMSTAAKVHKAVSKDPTALDSRTAIRMATRWGAEALGLGNITGSIEKGKAADLVLINIGKPHLTPVYDICSHIVYSLRASDVETVLVGGRIIVYEGQLKGRDEGEILDKATRWAEKIKTSRT